MRLLLLLSALLAALTSGAANARVPREQGVELAVRLATPEREPAHAHVLLAVRPPAAPVDETMRPLDELRPTAAPRLWMQRRRE